jgi:hypothetical protein
VPHTQKGLPFARASHTSYTAAMKAAAKRGPKTARYLRLLADKGPLTDHEAWAHLTAQIRIAFTSVQSIRNNAVDCLLVRRGGERRKSPYGGDCWTWELTNAGTKAVAAMTEAA